VLRTRILTALVLAALMLWALLALPVPGKIACIGLLMALGAWEWAAFARLTAWPARALYVGVALLLGAGAWRYWGTTGDWPRVLQLAVVWWIIALIWVTCAPQAVNRTAAGVAGYLVLVPAWFALARLLWVPGPTGTWLTIFMLTLVFAGDVGAYFAGRRLGRSKLAPTVSPNKTWEGFAGGVMTGLIVAAVGAVLFHLPPGPFVALCAVALLASVVGDLTESMFKRYAGLKDSGRLLPGHGGVLDRIDSVTAAGPFFVLGLKALGMMP
jgi:phosphatidate cytidylyltransferase